MRNNRYIRFLQANTVKNFATVVTAACAVSVLGTACSNTQTHAVLEQEETAASTDAVAATNNDETSKNEIAINVNGADITVSGTNSDSVKVDGTTITITEQGTYRLSGTLEEGQILVEAGDKDDVRLIFDGFTITNSETAPVNVVTSGDFTIELADGSENEVSDKRDAIVEEVTDDTTAEATDVPDAAIYSKSDMFILGTGKLTINGGYCDGIHGKDMLVISDEVTLDITSIQHGINGKDSLEIQSGTFNIVSGEDGLHSKGDVTISDGTLEITAEDDGIHSDYNLVINGGVINVSDSYEGLEALAITINDGTVTVKSSDDGMNAAGGADSSGGMFEATEGAAITINGGTVTVIARGDGLDSNGDIAVNGGEIYVDGPEMGGNGSLDYTGNATISGGTFAFTGSNGMFQTFSEDSGQTQLIVFYTEQQEAGTEITLTDSNGNILYENNDSTMAFSAFLFSSGDLKEGETYTIKTGDQEETVTIDGLVNTVGERSGGMMMGGGPGQGGPGMGGGPGQGGQGMGGGPGQGGQGMGGGPRQGAQSMGGAPEQGDQGMGAGPDQGSLEMSGEAGMGDSQDAQASNDIQSQS